MSATERRLTALRSKLEEANLDAYVVDSQSNRRYLSGFTGSNGVLVIGATTAHLITDSRYYGRVEREAPDFTLVRAGAAMFESLCETLEAIGARRIGFESDFVTVNRFALMRHNCPDHEWVDTAGWILGLRAVKDEEELAAITRAARLTDDAMAHAARVAQPGMREGELAWEIEAFMRQHGAQGTAFELIVASGANSALPHHSPGDNLLTTEEPIVVDIGARVDDYNADLTRTFTMGAAADAEYERVWEIVSAANEAVAARLKAGMAGRQADAIARDLIADAGYGEEFGHGLGHGVGLDIHELPRLSPTGDETPLEAGMVLTIEPGIYLPGRFGVRIEDLVVVREGGVELLSHAPKIPQGVADPTLA
jgi:Xaa-Pro aminopeptidase